MSLTPQQQERRRLRGEAMVDWIEALRTLPDDAVLSIRVDHLKRIVTCGAAICGNATNNVCGLLVKQLVADGEESPAARAAGEQLNLIR